MIRYSIESLKPGMKIGKRLYNEDGTLLLGKGVMISEFLIERLRAKGVYSVYVADDNSDDVEPDVNISDALRGSTIRHIRELFSSFEDVQREIGTATVEVLLDSISSPRFKKAFGQSEHLNSIKMVSQALVNELTVGEVSLGLTSIKTYDNYTFQHSIDVTIIAILIGRSLGYSRDRLREIGIGCLLHDIGKTFVPIEILNKNGRLTADEFSQVKMHSQIGYELMRDVPAIGVLPPHIAFQHHERQDGAGYPRGLTGTNNLEFSNESRTIHPYASITAVADVFDALSSDRPYRPAMPPEKVREIMYGMKGSHLNKEALLRFFSIAPLYPVGATIIVTEGDHRGYYGIVTRVHPDMSDRPSIRLTHTPDRECMDPVEIDTRDRIDITISAALL